jgi:broad specificity phosphatase PhoE
LAGDTVSKLILVKHSLPKIIPSQPARTWKLSTEGRLRCRPLAEELTEHAPDLIFCSTEIKAIQTGQDVADYLNIPCDIVDDLHEHDRRNVPFFENPEEFQASIAGFFAQPDELIFGMETADDAYSRFSQALDTILQKHPNRNIAIVAHGTVITLFAHRRASGAIANPFQFWKRLNLPSFVVLSLPDFELVTTVESVE